MSNIQHNFIFDITKNFNLPLASTALFNKLCYLIISVRLTTANKIEKYPETNSQGICLNGTIVANITHEETLSK